LASYADRDYDDAWSGSQRDARAAAANGAAAWALTIPCPDTCPYRELQVDIGDPSVPVMKHERDNDGHRVWRANCEAEWSGTVRCVKELPDDRDTVEADESGVIVNGEHRRAACDENIRANDKSLGEGSSLEKDCDCASRSVGKRSGLYRCQNGGAEDKMSG
jgi:hypothetical protein